VGALARVCCCRVSKPKKEQVQFRVEPAPLKSPVRIILDPPAADHPIIEIPCILYQRHGRSSCAFIYWFSASGITNGIICNVPRNMRIPVRHCNFLRKGFILLLGASEIRDQRSVLDLPIHRTVSAIHKIHKHCFGLFDETDQ